MRKIIDKNNRQILKKTLAGTLAGVFLFTSTISWAQEERLSSARTEGITFSSRPANISKLAPGLRVNSAEFKQSASVVAICKAIEKQDLGPRPVDKEFTYDVGTLKEIIEYSKKGSIHPAIVAEIERLVSESADIKIVRNAVEYMPGPFRICGIKNVKIKEDGRSLFAEYKQNTSARVQDILNRIDEKVKREVLKISDKDIAYLKENFVNTVDFLFNSELAGDLTYPQFEELLFVLVNMISPNLYNETKDISNTRGEAIYTSAREQIKKLQDMPDKVIGWENAFREAIIYAALGNGLEAKYYDQEMVQKADIENRSVGLEGFLNDIFRQVESNKRGAILYFLDNAGEIFTDLLVVELLLDKGFKVKLVAKESPTTDDLTVTDVNKIISELRNSGKGSYEWLKKYCDAKKLEVVSSGSKTPATDFNKVRSGLFENAIFSIYKGGGNHYGACPAILTSDSFHIFMIKEPLQRALMAAEGVDVAKNKKGALVFLHREASSRPITIDALLKDGSVFEQIDKSVKNEDQGNNIFLEHVWDRLGDVRKNFKNIHFIHQPNEVIIEVPDEGLAVRYFDPTKANVITPYSDVSKLETKVIGPRLNRQIIHRVKALTSASTESTETSVTHPILQIYYKDLITFGIKRITHGTQSLIETKEGWPFMLKLLIYEPEESVFPEETIKSYKIAQRKLGNLVCNFSFIELINEQGSRELAVIMQKIKLFDLSSQIKEALLSGKIEQAEKLIEGNVDLILRIIKRGAFLFDASFDNFGLLDDKQLLIDAGHLGETFNNSSIRKFTQIIQENYNYLTVSLESERLGKFYLDTLTKYGLDETIVKNTLQSYFGIDSAVSVPDISEEIAKSIAMGPWLNRQIIRRVEALPHVEGESSAPKMDTSAKEISLNSSDLARDISQAIEMLNRAKQAGNQNLIREAREKVAKLTTEVDKITRATYDRMSAKYKALRGQVPEGKDLEILQKFLALTGQQMPGTAKVKKRTKILDVGTSLRDMSWFSGQPDVSAIGIDYAESVVRSIREVREDVDVRHMNMLNLEFDSETFNGVRFQATLHHQPIIDSEQGADVAIHEAYRVLKPGGICYIFVKAETEARHAFMAVDTGEGLGARFYQFYSKEMLQQLLERNGLRLLGEIEEWADERGEKNLIAFAKKINMKQRFDNLKQIPVKAVVFDVDGNLTDADGNILPEGIDMIISLRELGIPVLLITARKYELDEKFKLKGGRDVKEVLLTVQKRLSHERRSAILEGLFVAAENGLHSVSNGFLEGEEGYKKYDESLFKVLGIVRDTAKEKRLKEFLIDVDLEKHGIFVEWREPKELVFGFVDRNKDRRKHLGALRSLLPGLLKDAKLWDDGIQISESDVTLELSFYKIDKSCAFVFFDKLLDIRDDAKGVIISAGDNGQKGGNDNPMLAGRKGGLSSNKFDIDDNNMIALKLISGQNVGFPSLLWAMKQFKYITRDGQISVMNAPKITAQAKDVSRNDASPDATEEKDLKDIERLIAEAATKLTEKQTFANKRHKRNFEMRKAEITNTLRNYPIDVVINFLTVLNTYLNDEIPDALLFKDFDQTLLDNLTNLTGKFHLWTTQAIEEFATHLNTKISEIKEKTGKDPLVLEVAAGYGDLSYRLKNLVQSSIKIIPTDGFYSDALQEKEELYDAKTIQARGVKNLRTDDIENGAFRNQLGISEDTPVIIIASHLPREGGVDKSLFNQTQVNELIFVTAYEPRSHRKGTGQEDILANDRVWEVTSRSLNSRTWFSGVLSLEGRLELKLETFSRRSSYPLSEPGAIIQQVTVHSGIDSILSGGVTEEDFVTRVLEMADRMGRRKSKTLSELIDSHKEPVNYQFPLRNPAKEKLSSWQQLSEAKTVLADDFLNLLTNYLGAGLPRLDMLEKIYEKTTFTLEEAREFLEILDRHTQAKYYVTATENREIKAYFEGKVLPKYPDLQKRDNSKSDIVTMEAIASVDRALEELAHGPIFDELKEILLGYRQRLSTVKVDYKDHKEIVTEVDHEIQNKLIRKIFDLCPTHRVVAEEVLPGELSRINQSNKDSPFLWVIDPLDGTNQFMNPVSKDYCIAVSLLFNGVPLASFILAPEFKYKDKDGILCAAIRGKGVFINGEPLVPERRQDLHSAIVYSELPDSEHEYLFPKYQYDAISKKFETVKTKPTSTTLDILRVFLGESELFIHPRPKLWDGLPAATIIELTGGHIFYPDGNNVFPVNSSTFNQSSPQRLPEPLVVTYSHGVKDFIIRLRMSNAASMKHKDALIDEVYRMLDLYNKENILSQHGIKVLSLLKAGRTSPDELGFDIDRLRGLSLPQTIEQLVTPKKYGGLNNGECLFISTREYRNQLLAAGSPLFQPHTSQRFILTSGCNNNCTFCLFGGKRPVASLPYPIVVKQIILRDYREEYQEDEYVGFVYYNNETDTFGYRDRICGANIADVILFDKNGFGDLRTAGYSPLDSDVQYVRNAVKQLRAAKGSTSHSLTITFHLFHYEIIKAIIDKDKDQLQKALKAYMEMYKELFLCWNAKICVIDRRDTSNDMQYELIKKIGEIQGKMLNELRCDKEIQNNPFVTDALGSNLLEEGIIWLPATSERLRHSHFNDPSVISFLESLNIDDVVTTGTRFRDESAIVKSQKDYIDKHAKLFKDILGEDKPDTLLRVPVEAIEGIGIDNIKDFLETFQQAPNGFVELYYMSGIGEVSESVYQKYGLDRKALPEGFKRTRENTVTLFPALKGEDINQAAIRSRLGSLDITPEDTILSPIGLQYDPAGLIRATILGLKIMDIARLINKKGVDSDMKDAINLNILHELRNALDAEDFSSFNLTPDDIIALATGNINNILTALKKLIKLLPITPIDAEELRQIYKHAREVLLAA